MTAKRILHVKPGEWSTGGVESFVMSMLENVDRDRVRFDLLTIGDRTGPSPHDDRLSELGGTRFSIVEPTHGPALSKLGPIRSLFDLVRHHGYGTVHIHTGSAFHALYAGTARLAGARTVVLHSHTAVRPELAVPVRRGLDALLRVGPTHRFACSRAAARALFPATAQPGVRILRNGIDVAGFRYDPGVREQVRAALGIVPGQLVLGHVGRFSWEKNHALLLRVFAEVARRSSGDGPQPLLLCIGDGEERAATEALAAGLGIAGQVRFLGVRHDIARLLQAMDVFLLPSRNEGLGIAGVEAQAAGLPCVCSTGVPDEIDVTGRCSFLPDTADPADWADAVAAAASLPRVDTAGQVAAAGYDAADCARQLQDFYLRGEPA
ncbi:MAG: glycosyltransferase [Propionicimonas sp.]|nr:glycosyltransferase [Propionicimonas sp.]